MPSAREFLHEFIAHYVALEGKLWRTLALLLFRPGALSKEYIAGRRVRYVEPLRIYLTFSILLFAILRFGSGDLVHVNNSEQVHLTTQAVEQTGQPGEEKQIHLRYSMLGQFPVLSSQWQRFEQLSGAEQKRLAIESFFHYAPYGMFCLMPIFALYLKILYLGSGRRYGEHFLFALHTNAFAFIMMALIVIMPGLFFRMALGCWLLAYLPWAMWRVYAGNKFGTAVRWLLLMTSYSITLSIAALASVATGVMLSH